MEHYEYDCPRTGQKYAVPALPARTHTTTGHTTALVLSGVENKAVRLSALIIDALARLEGGQGKLPQILALLRMSQFVDHVSVSILQSVNLKYETWCLSGQLYLYQLDRARRTEYSQACLKRETGGGNLNSMYY